MEEKIQLLEKAIDQCFAHIAQPLQEGVRNARTSYRRILGACLVVSDPFPGKPVTLVRSASSHGQDLVVARRKLILRSTGVKGMEEWRG